MMFILISTFSIIYAYDGTDLLEGEGSFDNEVNWIMNQTEEYLTASFEESDSKYLKLSKAEESELNFREGLYHLFNPSTPQHLRFWFASGNKEVEDTNLRLKDTSTDLTAVSFRCGYAGFVRVNDNQMVTFYNNSVSSDSAIFWTQADIILDWNNKEVLIFINESYLGSAGFYHSEITEINQVLLYNLKPETDSWWKDIKICNERCDNFASTSIMTITLLLIVSLL